MIVPVYAADDTSYTVQLEDGSTVTYFSDGSKLTVSGVIEDESTTSTLATAKTVTKHREATYTNGNGEVDWRYTLYATFSYVPGVSSTCTNTYYTQNIYEGNWTFSNGSATKSGNKAYGKGTYELKVLFITTKTCNIDISLTCDVNGNVT